MDASSDEPKPVASKAGCAASCRGWFRLKRKPIDVFGTRRNEPRAAVVAVASWWLTTRIWSLIEASGPCSVTAEPTDAKAPKPRPTAMAMALIARRLPVPRCVVRSVAAWKLRICMSLVTLRPTRCSACKCAPAPPCYPLHCLNAWPVAARKSSDGGIPWRPCADGDLHQESGKVTFSH